MNDEEILPIDVECPACLAKPLHPCTQPTDTGRRAVSWFHLARIAEAQGD